MKILVVHDRVAIGDRISEIVISDDSRNHVDRANDYFSARALLSAEIYDLLIIDLTIPYTSASGSPSYEAVHDLLKELFASETLNVPGDIIGITQDLDTLTRIGAELGPHLMVAIEEDTDSLWEQYLIDKLAYARHAANTRYISVNQHHDYDALIVTAMDAEMVPYEENFEMRALKHFRGAKEFLFNDRDGNIRRGIAYSIGRSGQPSAASMTQALITFFRPKVALMSGYCGGVKGKVELGDLIFFEAAYAWDYGKWTEEGDPPSAVFRVRPDPISIVNELLHDIARKYATSNFRKTPELLEQINQKSKGLVKSFDMFIKPAASGSAVVAADEIVSQIRGMSDSAWAVDMEAYGFYCAADNTRVIKPQFMCLKAVSDFSNGEKGDELHTTCSYISSVVVVDLLTEKWDFE